MINPIRKILGYLYGRMRESYYNERYDYYRKIYRIKEGFKFNGVDIRIYGHGEIQLGEGSYIGNYSTLQLTKGYKLVIGRNCQISHNVRIYTSSSDPDQDFTTDKTKPAKKGDVVIGNGVWIGANVFINPGVKIGSNSVIGANSIVTRDVLDNSIVGGVPAKLIRMKSKL